MVGSMFAGDLANIHGMQTGDELQGMLEARADALASRSSIQPIATAPPTDTKPTPPPPAAVLPPLQALPPILSGILPQPGQTGLPTPPASTAQRFPGGNSDGPIRAATQPPAGVLPPTDHGLAGSLPVGADPGHGTIFSSDPGTGVTPNHPDTPAVATTTSGQGSTDPNSVSSILRQIASTANGANEPLGMQATSVPEYTTMNNSSSTSGNPTTNGIVGLLVIAIVGIAGWYTYKHFAKKHASGGPATE